MATTIAKPYCIIFTCIYQKGVFYRAYHFYFLLNKLKIILQLLYETKSSLFFPPILYGEDDWNGKKWAFIHSSISIDLLPTLEKAQFQANELAQWTH